MLLSELLYKYKDKSGTSFARISNIFNGDSELYAELILKTPFLPENSPINQRFYHVFFNDGEQLCGCRKPLQFTGRFSPDKNKKGSNYLETCESASCIFDSLLMRGRNNPNSIEMTLYRIKKDLELSKEVENRTSFLDIEYTNISFNQRLYHIWFDIYSIEKCLYCQHNRKFNPTGKFSTNKNKLNYTLKTCGSDECHKKHIGETTKQSILKKYGVENFSQTLEWKEKVKSTNLEKKGVEWNTQNKEFIKITQAAIKSNLSEVIMKRKKTYVKNSLEKYGVSHPMQKVEVFKKVMKNFYRRKEYTLPSGKKLFVQGYEPIVLDDLFKVYLENDILIDDSDIENRVGKIFYKYDGKTRRYYPDIYIVSENKIIEVKSQYTYDIDLLINIAKRDACINHGLEFAFEIR